LFPFHRRFPRPCFLDPLLSPNAAAERFALINARTGETLAERIEPALDSRTRGKGLVGRSHLPAGSGMIIAPCSSIHTFFMKFAIDVVFVKADGRVAKIARELGAWRLAGAVGAFGVVELPAGAAARTTVGDQLRVQKSAM
jgi:uncharacterized membrane protein (UPF0127 family)